MTLTVLNPFDRGQAFPEIEKALREPNGLLAIGGCLSVQRLRTAYRQGIFPWFGPGEPILWWSPDPRLVLYPARLNRSRSLRKRLARGEFGFSFDRAFPAVLEACSAPRGYTAETWITAEMKAAYLTCFEQGLAHSFEAWRGTELVGGLYGLTIGRVFFGESMFHTATDASKAALAFACSTLSGWLYQMIDCQVRTAHLISLGAEEIPRSRFLAMLDEYCDLEPAVASWTAVGGDCR